MTPFSNKPDSSSDLTIFIVSFIFSCETISVVSYKAKSEWRKAKSEKRQPDPILFFGIAAYIAGTAAVNPNGILYLFNGLVV